MNSANVFRKALSLNDTGETGGHMAGILIPRSDIGFFPPLDPTAKNPRATLSMTDRDGRNWRLAYIYYNNSRFGGTRDEYRLTGLTDFIRTYGLVGGDTVVITKQPAGTYLLDFVKPQPDSTEPVEKPPEAPKTSHDHVLRPAARIIHTIGEHLIKDPQAAVIEMVKNSYDADARTAHVHFSLTTTPAGQRELCIAVRDDGHGMTYEDVTKSWLVPATPDKVSRRTSPGGRALQGNKGIGRFAAFMLGNEIFLTTVSSKSPLETSLLLQASDFRTAEFLDEVPVIVDTREASPDTKPGTSFEMASREGDAAFRQWGMEDFAKLRVDLRRMLFPFRSRNDEFQIWVHYQGFTDFGQPDGTEEIQPLPVFDFFDYRIKAQVNEDGTVQGLFNSPLVAGIPEETLSFHMADLKGKPCGLVAVDLRVVDREAIALQNLLDRSRAAEDSLTGVSRAQLKKLLDEACGVSVYRGDFRIRPYGDTGNDWLDLDRQRINNPTLFISNNQAFGTVLIETEDKSHLEEKSARDGLREDDYYDRLRDVVSRLVLELQRRRYEIRRAVGRIQKSTRVAQMLSDLRDYEKPFNRISTLLKNLGIDQEKIERVRGILQKDSEGRQEIIAKLENTIAIYQGQATLGKMVSVLLHEGNRSLGILRNQAARIPPWLRGLLSSPDTQTVTEVTEGLTGIESAAESLVELFDRIQPLGVRARGHPHEVVLLKPIRAALRAMSGQLSKAGISTRLEVPADFKVLAWEQDLRTIFLNLVDNSIYWLQQGHTVAPEILFHLVRSEDGASLDILDNGPGIPREHILSEAIFEPHFSLKGGYGIGLPIAGESAARNDFELRALHCATGAHFVLDFAPPKQHSTP